MKPRSELNVIASNLLDAIDRLAAFATGGLTRRRPVAAAAAI